MKYKTLSTNKMNKLSEYRDKQKTVLSGIVIAKKVYTKNKKKISKISRCT